MKIPVVLVALYLTKSTDGHFPNPRSLWKELAARLVVRALVESKSWITYNRYYQLQSSATGEQVKDLGEPYASFIDALEELRNYVLCHEVYLTKRSWKIKCFA